MKILLHAKFPHEVFNRTVQEGTAGEKIKRILAEVKPEAVYFTEYDGRRGCIMVVEMTDSSQIPTLAEPWFLTFNADVEFHIAMTPEDLAKSDLSALGKKWR